MSQVVYSILEGDLCQLILPSERESVLPGVVWGAFDELMTPAYWKCQAWQHEILGTYKHLRFGNTLVEEVAACLLGGFGMPAEIGLAAYNCLRAAGQLKGRPSSELIEAILRTPLQCGGKQKAYRFPRQKARYLADCLARLEGFIEPSDDINLRDALAMLPGIGLKTASWIVRNWRSSDDVAVIDIHILRAGRRMDLFDISWTPQRHYRELEEAFLTFSRAIETPSSLLDSLIWDHMRRMPKLKQRQAPSQDRVKEHEDEAQQFVF